MPNAKKSGYVPIFLLKWISFLLELHIFLIFYLNQEYLLAYDSEKKLVFYYWLKNQNMN
jgi:hypothetical protein